MEEAWKKKRTKLGKFMDEHGISQKYVSEETGLGKDTLTRICTIGNKTQSPTKSTRKLVEDAIRQKVPWVKSSDLW